MENVKKFFEALSSDKALQEKAMALNEKFKDRSPNDAETKKLIAEEVVALAGSAGFAFTSEELKTYTEQMKAPQKLSDDELDAVAGGVGYGCNCFAAGGGGGTDDDGDTVGCACIAYGQGGDAKNDNCCCLCIAVGEGYS